MMKLADMTVTGFADTVASDAPAPGGGSCAALYGSIGAALTAMVGGLTPAKALIDCAEFYLKAKDFDCKKLVMEYHLIDME